MTDVLVTGHLCLDVIPSFPHGNVTFKPGHLTEVGAATFATGGGVSNVGLALIGLGISTKLVGKVSDDFFGDAIVRILKSYNATATEQLIIETGGSSSYTLVLNPPNHDRTFLHNPGCNDTFRAGDIRLETLGDAKLFYFGYPSLMRAIREDPFAFANLYQAAKTRGLVTCLDMSLPDTNGDSGKVNWKHFLETSLPYVDIFLPSLEEILFMFDRPFYDSGNWQQPMPASYLYTLTQKMLDLGVAIAGIKLGEQGLYLHTGSKERLEPLNHLIKPENWSKKELWSPVFEVEVKGTVGAGDSAIAGFLASLLKGLSPEEAVTMACAVGACCVEAPDASSSIQSWEETIARVNTGWSRGFNTSLNDWQLLSQGVYSRQENTAETPK